MATRQYDIARNKNVWEVTESVGGVISDAVRVTVDEATVPNKFEFVGILEQMKLYILKDEWPPST